MAIRARGVAPLGPRPVAGLALLALATAAAAQDGPPQPAAAPAAAAADAGNPSDIIVTALRRGERLKDVPASISVFNARTILNANINNAKDVAVRVPNFSIVETQQPGQPLIDIRGVSSVRGGEPPIAVVIDGVQLLDAANITQDLFDIERIEVLKGPQSAVYGRTAIAGALNITTRQPTNDYAGSVQGSYGTGDDFRGVGAVSGPIAKDKLLFRIAGSIRNFDGDIGNLNAPTSRDANWVRDRSVRALLLARPVDDLTIDLRYAHLYTRAGASYYVPLTPGRGDNTPYPYEGNVANGANRYLDEASARIALDLGGATVISTTALNKTRTSLYEDLDYTPADGFIATQRRRTRSINQELRVTSNGSGPFKWLGGLYYLNVRQRPTTNVFVGADYAPAFGIDPALTPLLISQSSVRNRIDDYAAFGQASYRFDFGVQLSAALRYDVDDRSQVDFIAPGRPKYSKKFDSWQPQFSANYFLPSGSMAYVTIGKGFRSGGFNPVDLISRTYGKEENWNYEVGYKATLLDRKMSINGAVFYTHFKNRQVYILDLQTSTENISNPIPKARAVGVEVEVDAQPIRRLSISASGGMTDTRIQRYDTGVFANLFGNPLVAGVDFTGKRLPYVARFSWAGSAQYEIPFGASDSVTPRVELNGSGGGYYWEINNRVRREDLNLVNLRLIYRHGPATLTGFVENLFRKRYVAEFVQGEWAGAPGDYSAAARGRIFGVQGRLAF